MNPAVVSKPHIFRESLARSHAAEDLPLWEEVYRKAFPTMVSMANHRQDGYHQRLGIDRSITLANAKQILIDEKFRGRNEKTGKVYDDIALEYLSNRDRNIPGWVCKSLLADYIAYAIGPLGKCYLLPVLQLQQAWKNNSRTWLKAYQQIPAQNEGWVTMSLCLPVPVLFKAIGNCLRIEFSPFDICEETPGEEW